MRHIRERHDIGITRANVTLLSLGEAVKRWTADGQFLMTEVNGTDSYQSSDNNIERGSYSERLSKIEAALAGMDFVKDVKATGSHEPTLTPEPTPSPEPSPSAGE